MENLKNQDTQNLALPQKLKELILKALSSDRPESFIGEILDLLNDINEKLTGEKFSHEDEVTIENLQEFLREGKKYGLRGGNFFTYYLNDGGFSRLTIRLDQEVGIRAKINSESGRRVEQAWVEMGGEPTHVDLYESHEYKIK